MERELWRWVIREISDKNLVYIICLVNESLTSRRKISIKGISDLTKIKPEQMHLFRSRIETELCKPVNITRVQKILLTFISKIDGNKDYQSLCDKDIDVIWDELKTSKLSNHNMIMYLLAQNNNNYFEKALNLYQRILEERKTDRHSDTKTVSQNLQTGKERNNELRENIDNELQRLRAENNNLLEEKLKLLKENKELKKAVSRSESDRREATKIQLEIRRELNQKKKDILSYERKNQELKESLDKLKEILDNTINENRSLKKSLVEITEIKKVLEENIKEIHIETSKRKITIIDRVLPEGLEEISSVRFNLIVPNQLDQMMVSDDLNSSDEIWFIKFRLPIPKQQMLREKYGMKVTGFGTYNELKKYCNIR